MEGQINLPTRTNSHLSSEVHLMLFHWSENTKVSLEPFGVVVKNEILNHRYKARPVSESYSIVPFAFQDSPEPFHRTVIYTLGNSGHTLCYASFGEHTVESTVSILESSIAVAQWMSIRFGSNRRPKSVEHRVYGWFSGCCNCLFRHP